MRAPLMTAVRLAVASLPLASLPLAALTLAALPLATLVGCDSPTNRADKAANALILQAQQAMADPTRLEEAISTLQTATTGDITPATRIRGKALLGQLQLRQARELQWQIDRLDRDAQRLAVEIAQLAGQVQLVAQLANGYRRFDPAQTLLEIGQRGQQVRGGADQSEWFRIGDISFENLAALSQRISRLEGQIAEVQEQIRTLDEQRRASLLAAESEAQRAELATGRDAVDAFIQASNARRQASDLGTRIETLEESLKPLQQELQIATAQKEFVQAAAQQLDAEANLLQGGWASLQEAIRKQQELAARIVTFSEKLPELKMQGVNVFPASSLQEKASRLAEVGRAADQKRAEVIALLQEAEKHLGDAGSTAERLAGEVRSAMGARPTAPATETAAMMALLNALSPAQFQLDQSDALRLLAETYAAEAASLQARIDAAAMAQAALTAAGLAVPPELADSSLPEKKRRALEEADTRYQSSDELLETIVSGRQEQPTEKAAVTDARVARIYALYRWSILAADRGDLESAKRHMDSAKTQVLDAVSNGERLPKLPPELQALADAPPKEEQPAPERDEPEPSPPVENPG